MFIGRETQSIPVVDRIVQDVSIRIDVTAEELQWILAEKSSPGWIVVSGGVIPCSGYLAYSKAAILRRKVARGEAPAGQERVLGNRAPQTAHACETVIGRHGKRGEDTTGARPAEVSRGGGCPRFAVPNLGLGVAAGV